MTSVGVMASAVVSGVCTSVLREPFNDYTTNGWTLTGTPTIVAGRTGTGARVADTSAALFAIPAPSQNDYITVGLAFRVAALSITRSFVSFRRSGTVEDRLALNSDGSLQFFRGSSSIAGSAPGLITINTWYYIESQFLNAASPDGWAKMRLNGTEVINATGLNTRIGGTPNELYLQAVSGIVHLYDDLYLTTGSGCSFQGDQVIP